MRGGLEHLSFLEIKLKKYINIMRGFYSMFSGKTFSQIPGLRTDLQLTLKRLQMERLTTA